MDGFHMLNEDLVRLGRRNRKGAPDTFDVAGFVAMLRPDTPSERRRSRHRTRVTTVLPAHRFPTPSSVASDDALVITEGNYLLLDHSPWDDVRPLLDEVWFVDIDNAVRVPRLIARHIEFGKTPDGGPRMGHAIGRGQRRPGRHHPQSRRRRGPHAVALGDEMSRPAPQIAHRGQNRGSQPARTRGRQSTRAVPAHGSAVGGAAVSRVGRVKPTVVPPPSRGSAKTVPPWDSTMSRTIARPRPEPGRLREATDR